MKEKAGDLMWARGATLLPDRDRVTQNPDRYVAFRTKSGGQLARLPDNSF